MRSEPSGHCTRRPCTRWPAPHRLRFDAIGRFRGKAGTGLPPDATPAQLDLDLAHLQAELGECSVDLISSTIAQQVFVREVLVGHACLRSACACQHSIADGVHLCTQEERRAIMRRPHEHKGLTA